jgi:hypothetical protein
VSAAPSRESVPGFYRRVRQSLSAGGLPLGEAMHPVTLAALAALVVNDWALKPRFGPSFITGKLSDIAGLVCAPLLLSALIGLCLWLVTKLGGRVDPRLTQRRLVLCIAVTGLAFSAIKLSEHAATWFTMAVSMLGRPAEVYLDRTDLLTLPALAIAWWIGRDELRRVRPNLAQRYVDRESHSGSG